MAWFFRIIETADGGWTCRSGLVEYDTHTELAHAIEHIAALAARHRPAEGFLHRLDGSVDQLGPL